MPARTVRTWTCLATCSCCGLDVVIALLRVGGRRSRVCIERVKSLETLGDRSDVARQGTLAVLGETGDADADQTERAGPIAERAVEEGACKLTDPLAVVGADRHGRRARPDGEVGIAKLGRDGAANLSAGAQVLTEPKRLPAELVVQPFRVADVVGEGLLDRDRDAL